MCALSLRKNVSKVEDLRAISLVTSFYKIIAKIREKRSRKVRDQLVSRERMVVRFGSRMHQGVSRITLSSIVGRPLPTPRPPFSPLSRKLLLIFFKETEPFKDNMKKIQWYYQCIQNISHKREGNKG